MLKSARLALDQLREPDPQHGSAVRQRHVSADPVTDRDGHVELLFTLTDQGRYVSFARFNLAARKLPPARDLRRFCPLTTQHSTIDKNCRADNDQRSHPLSVHGALACQMVVRSVDPPTP